MDLIRASSRFAKIADHLECQLPGDKLRLGNVVIAPAEDGGYVLVGLARPAPMLFDGIAWGSSAVMGQTRSKLAQAGVRWKELATYWDVDRPEDYARLQQEGLLAEVLS